MMQNNNNSKGFRRFLRDNGYYLVIGLCALAVGVSGYNAWDNHTPLNLVLLLTEKRESLRLEAQYDRHKLVLDALRTGRTCDIVDALYKHYQDYSAINYCCTHFSVIEPLAVSAPASGAARRPPFQLQEVPPMDHG